MGDDRDFVADLGATQDGDEWLFRMMQRAPEIFEFFLHEEPGSRFLHELGHPHGRSMGAMGSSECVVYVVIRQLRELLREMFIIGFFFRVEAEVLEQKSLTLLEFAGDFLSFGAHALRAKTDVLAPSP